MNNKFSSKWGFILTTVGSAVGIGNVWGFPYKFLKNGALSFLIYYIFFVILFSYVGLSSEYAIGRLCSHGTLGSYEYTWKEKNKKVSKIIGYFPLLGTLLLSTGYAVIVAYIFKSLCNSIDGSLLNVDVDSWFSYFSTQSNVYVYHFFTILITLLTCVTGAKSIEKANKFMMPLFFILFLFLTFRVLFFHNSLAGYKFMISFNFKDFINPKVILSAMGQAFFSLSITGNVMIVYGSYLDKKENIVSGAKQTALFDTLAALVASFVIIPSIFAFSQNATSKAGPGLLFVTLPKIMQNIYGGRIFSIILYMAVLFGGITSLQSMYESICVSLMYKFKKLKRKVALVIIGICSFVPGIFMQHINVWGNFMDIVSIYIIPIAATLGAISWFFVLDKNKLLNEINLNKDNTKYGNSFYFLGKYVYTPIVVFLCLFALIFRISF